MNVERVSSVILTSARITRILKNVETSIAQFRKIPYFAKR